MCPECRKLESKESVSKQSLTVATEAKGLTPPNGESKESGLEVKESAMEEPDSVETNQVPEKVSEMVDVEMKPV